jgi:5-methylthioribose kinase
MVNENETYVIDSEFAFVGPMGFDIGALIANLAMSWVSHTVQASNTNYTDFILDTIKEIWKRFERKFRTLWNETEESALFTPGFANEAIFRGYQEQFMRTLLQESIGFAGCKIIRRQFGIAGVEDIRGIEDTQVREKANRMAVAIGERFIKRYHTVESIDEVIRMLSASQ